MSNKNFYKKWKSELVRNESLRAELKRERLYKRICFATAVISLAFLFGFIITINSIL